MARYELLNNITHKDLRVSTRFGTEFGDNLGMVQAFPTEFAELQREYPIFFRKDSSGEFQAAALLASTTTRTCSCRVAAGMPRTCRARSPAARS